MRLTLIGTRSFGQSALEAILASGHTVAGVIAPEGDRLWHAAVRRRLPVVVGPDPRWIRMTHPDVMVAAHSHDYVGREARQAPTLGTFGYHPSLLPRHRGKDSVEWTVRMRDPIAGGSTYWFDRGVDTGPIAAQDWCHVKSDWTASDLWRERLFPMGISLILRTLEDLDQGRIVAVPQDEAYATWEPSIDTPPLHRPDLIAIGSGPDGYETIASREDGRARVGR